MRRVVAVLAVAAVAGTLLAEPRPAAAAAPLQLSIDTFAGTPSTGGPLTVAQQPFGLLATSQALLVADPANRVIRSISCFNPPDARPAAAPAVSPLCNNNTEDVLLGNGGMGAPGEPQAFRTNASLTGAYAIAQSPAGGTFVADTYGNRIRFMDTEAHVFDVAGTGAMGFAGDGGDPMKAQLDAPYGIAVMPGGPNVTVYVADTFNNRIRSFSVGGSIRTVALSAQLNQPRGLAVDCKGGLLIADTGNNAVRRYDPGSGTTTTLAGTGAAGFAGDGGGAASAQLRQPSAVAVAPNCDVLVADTGNNRVRRIRGGVIATIAGTGAAGRGGDGGPATSAQLNSPFAVAALADDDVAIGDTGNDVVREVKAGTISTIAGNGTASLGTSLEDPGALPQLGGPTAVAVDAGGGGGQASPCAGRPDSTGRSTAVMTLDSFSNTLRAICQMFPATPPNQGVSDPPTIDVVDLVGNGHAGSGQGQLSTPLGMALGADQSGGDRVEPPIYVADTFNNRILQVDPTSSPATMSVIAGTGRAGYSGDGGLATNAQLSYPTGLAFVDDPLGSGHPTLYIADTYNQRIRALDLQTGVITTVAGTGVTGNDGDGGRGIDAQLAYPYGLAFDNQSTIVGNQPQSKLTLLVADSFNNRIRQVDLGTGVISAFAGSGAAGFADGSVASARFNRPWSIAVGHGSEGGTTVYVADYLNHRVRTINGSTVGTEAGTGTPGLDGDPGQASAAEVSAPRAITTVDDQQGLLVADTFNNAVRRIGIGRSQVNNGLSAAFPDTRTGTANFLDIKVQNVGNGFLPGVKLSSDNPVFTEADNGECLSAGLHPMQSCTVSVRFQPTTPGQATGHLKLSDGQTVAVTGKGTQPALTILDPTGKDVTNGRINFPQRFPNQTFVTFKNTGDAPLNISSWGFGKYQPPDDDTHPAFASPSDCLGTLNPGATCQFTITLYGGPNAAFPPADQGRFHSGTLFVADDATVAGQSVTQTVDVFYEPQIIA